ncbi:MAG: DNA-directed RNA polymerase subunit omega [Lachnospiraceae bacterium]|nr:DNA-directed RNA polymerase subunit omega [Lachnospiraceae bacterium]
MLHPSYSDLMKVVNKDVEEGDTPVVNSRYSIVMATAKRARQIVARQTRGGEEMRHLAVSKPLSKAVNELYTGQLRILPGEEEASDAGKEAPVLTLEEAADMDGAAGENLPQADSLTE